MQSSAKATLLVALHTGTISRRERKGSIPNRDYLSSCIKYEGDVLLDAEQEGVMMQW